MTKGPSNGGIGKMRVSTPNILNIFWNEFPGEDLQSRLLRLWTRWCEDELKRKALLREIKHKIFSASSIQESSSWPLLSSKPLPTTKKKYWRMIIKLENTLCVCLCVYLRRTRFKFKRFQRHVRIDYSTKFCCCYFWVKPSA